jgi:signal transduction histidine kinase
MPSDFMRFSLINRPIIRNLILMLAFGVFSLLLGRISLFLPGLEGGGSDMREIAVLLSVIYLPHWLYLVGVSFITSVSFPAGEIEMSTFLMHCTAGIFAWFFYSFIHKRVSRSYYLGIYWAGMVILYYIFFLIPTMVIVYLAYGVINKTSIISTYKQVLVGFRIELFTATAVTSLFVILHRTTEILKIRNRELQIALTRSEESDRLKSAFLANISHEIRTPMNGIIGFSDLLAAPDLTADMRRTYAELISTSSHQLLSIINNILDISHIESGQTEISLDQVSLNEIFDNISQFYFTKAREKRISFHIVKTLDDETDRIITDRDKLQQILDNLLDNAFKFIREGEIKLGYVLDADMVRFYVEDTGPGIQAIQQEKIFERFTKVNVVKERLIGGTGVGLAISKALVELLGGSIMVSSVPGKGSVFSFTLPYRNTLVSS